MPKTDIYVDVGPMASKKTDLDPQLAKSMPGLMRKTAERVLAREKGLTTKKSGKPQGFQIDGTLGSLTKKANGRNAVVACKVSLVLATYPKKKIVAMPSGGASVQAADSPKDLASAAEDCVAAVIDDLVRKSAKVIRAKAG